MSIVKPDLPTQQFVSIKAEGFENLSATFFIDDMLYVYNDEQNVNNANSLDSNQQVDKYIGAPIGSKLPPSYLDSIIEKNSNTK